MVAYVSRIHKNDLFIFRILILILILLPPVYYSHSLSIRATSSKNCIIWNQSLLRGDWLIKVVSRRVLRRRCQLDDIWALISVGALFEPVELIKFLHLFHEMRFGLPFLILVVLDPVHIGVEASVNVDIAVSWHLPINLIPQIFLLNINHQILWLHFQ